MPSVACPGCQRLITYQLHELPLTVECIGCQAQFRLDPPRPLDPDHIRFACPRCQAPHSISSSAAGTKINCQKCGQRLQAPGPPPNKTVLARPLAPEPEVLPLASSPALPDWPQRPRPRIRPVLVAVAIGCLFVLALGVLGAAVFLSGQPAVTASPTASSSNDGAVLGLVSFGIVLVVLWVVGTFLGFCVYMTPSFIAIVRRHPNWPAILALNLLTGWLFIGWVAALVWAMTDSQPTRQAIHIHHH